MRSLLPRTCEPPAKRIHAQKAHGNRKRDAGKVRFTWGHRQAVAPCAPPPPPSSPLEHPGHGAGWAVRVALGRPESFSSRLDAPPCRACSREARTPARRPRESALPRAPWPRVQLDVDAVSFQQQAEAPPTLCDWLWGRPITRRDLGRRTNQGTEGGATPPRAAIQRLWAGSRRQGRFHPGSSRPLRRMRGKVTQRVRRLRCPFGSPPETEGTAVLPAVLPRPQASVPLPRPASPCLPFSRRLTLHLRGSSAE